MIYDSIEYHANQVSVKRLFCSSFVPNGYFVLCETIEQNENKKKFEKGLSNRFGGSI